MLKKVLFLVVIAALLLVVLMQTGVVKTSRNKTIEFEEE